MIEGNPAKVNNNLQSKEIKALVGIRGVAALYVALYHSLENQKYPYKIGLQVFINHGYLAVDLFFILSGFVMTLSQKKYFDGKFSIKAFLNFMAKRFARLYPMYFVVLVVGFVFINHFHGKLNFVIGLSMLSILFAQGYVLMHTWSLNAEWIAYLVYPLLLNICIKVNKGIWNVFIILISTILLLYSLKLQRDNGIFAVPTAISAITKCLAEYLLGITCYELIKRWPTILTFQNAISVISTLSILILLFFEGSDWIVILLVAPLIISLSTGKTWFGLIMASKPFYLLGLISYSYYLIHPIFVGLFRNAFYTKYGYLTSSILIFNILYVFTVGLTSYFTFKIIELPMQKYLNKRLKMA